MRVIIQQDMKKVYFLKKILMLCGLACFVFVFTAAPSCSGQVKKNRSTRLGVKGLLRLPTKGTKAALTLSHSPKDLKQIEAGVEGNCELLDSGFNYITSTHTDADGHFLFLLDDSAVVDTTNDKSEEKVTYFIRCHVVQANGGEAVQITTFSKSREAATAGSSSGALPTISNDLDTKHTVQSLLIYRGNNFNPLTATDTTEPPSIAGFTGLVSTSEKALNLRNNTKLGGKTIGSSLARLFDAVTTLNDGNNLSDGTSSLEAMNLLFNADSKTSATKVAALTSTLKNNANLADVTSQTVVSDADATHTLTSVLNLFVKNSQFDKIDNASGDVLIGAVNAHLPGEITAMFATDALIGTLFDMGKNLTLPSNATASDLDYLKSSLDDFLTPTLIAASTKNPKELAVIKAAVQHLIDSGKGDTSASGILASGFEGVRSSYWDGLTDSSNNAVAGIQNIVNYVVRTKDQFDTDPSGDNKVTDVATVLNALDSATDYGSEDATALAAEADIRNQQSAITFNPLSCQNSQGGDYCVDSDSNLQCGCDNLCETRNDCCSDKVTVCGTTSLQNFLTQNGQDATTSNFNETGSETIKNSGTPSISLVTFHLDTDSTPTAGEDVTVDADQSSQSVTFDIAEAPEDKIKMTQTCIQCSSDNASFQIMSCDTALDSSLAASLSFFKDSQNFRTHCFSDPNASSSLVYFDVSYKDPDGNEVIKTESTSFNLTLLNP